MKLARPIACLALLWLSLPCCGDDSPYDPAPDGGLADLAPVAPDWGEDPGQVIRLASYNLHNLFDTVDDPAGNDDVLTVGQLEAKLDRLEGVLRQMNADVVAVQEVENQEMLDRLFGDRLADMGYSERRLIPGTHTRCINVAVASRFPIHDVVSHMDDRWVGPDGGTYYFNPDCLEVRLAVGGTQLTLLINHFISQAMGSVTEPIREAAGQRVHQIVEGILQGNAKAMVAVMGDLNDEVGSPALTWILGQGESVTYDLSGLLPSEDRYTYVYYDDKKVLDYIIVTPALRDALVEVDILHSGDVAEASDHYPIMADFRF